MSFRKAPPRLSSSDRADETRIFQALTTDWQDLRSISIKAFGESTHRKRHM
jgi:hypothetical protein